MVKKLLELFAGTRSISRAFEAKGWATYSVEWDKKFKNISLYADISTLTADQIIELCEGAPNVIWASPDCTSYSIAGIGFHRKMELGIIKPVSDYAKFCDMTNTHLLELIEELAPQYFFIENPVGALRKMPFMLNKEKTGLMKRYTVTYCQYGDRRRKPTDIWTNHPYPEFKPICHNGDKCHEPAPRGSRTGTQGLKNAQERATIPAELCAHIVDICEKKPAIKPLTIFDFIEVEQ